MTPGATRVLQVALPPFLKGDRGRFDGANNSAIHLISREARASYALTRSPKIIDVTTMTTDKNCQFAREMSANGLRIAARAPHRTYRLKV